MLREMFSTKLEVGVRWLEPAWKSIISNKALLPLLWEMFPNHPNLLPILRKMIIRKWKNMWLNRSFSREGANVWIIENGKTIEAAEESL